MGERRRETLLQSARDKNQCCAFLETLKTEYCTNFGEFESKNGKQLIAALAEVLQEFDQRQFECVWTDLSKLMFEALSCISNRIKDNVEAVQMETEDDTSVQVLESVCTILLASIRLEELSVTKDLLQALKLLHGSLFDLHELEPSLASCVCLICVEWWNKKLPSHEHLCINVISHLLKMFLTSEELDKLSAVCSIQDCLSLFDFQRKPLSDQTLANPDNQSESAYTQSVIEELRQMLLLCFQNTHILKDSSGRKFLSSVLLLHKDLMKDAHQVVIESITHKYLLAKAEALGNIYFQSWRSAGQEMKELFEEICIQDLMFRTVHAPRAKDKNLFTPLQAMLFSIICHKGGLEVRHMITRLYSPILWRFLKANNTMVRANASNLLLDAFPMEEEDSNQPRVAENEEFMRQQYDAISNMLMDTCPKIRVIGIIGLCNILHMYWDAIPAHVIAILTQKLYHDLAFDATMDVRHAVFKATITLLDTPCSHPLLAKILPPCVEKCLHDVSERVRIAVAEVLLAVKQTSTITFWSVCPVQNIIAQLEIDGKLVSKRLVKLLFRSFIPEDKPVQTWVERCVNFFKREVNAARKFYIFAEQDLTTQEIGEFLTLIGVFIYNSVTRALQQENSINDSEMSQMENSDNTNLSNVSTLSSAPIESDVLSALLDTSCILWKSLERKISSAKMSGKNRDMIKKIMMTFSKSLHVCLKFANDERTINAILLLSSNLPPASLPVFSKSVIPKLRSAPDESPQSYYGMLIKCVCSWDWTKQLLALINDWLTEAVQEFGSNDSNSTMEHSSASRRSARLSKSTTDNDASATKSKKRKKKVSFTVKKQFRPGQALKYLSTFLEVQSKCSFSALDKDNCVKILLSISNTLEKCQVEILDRVSSTGNTATWSESLLVEAIEKRCQLISVIYLHQRQKSKESKGTDEENSNLREDVKIEEFKSIASWFNIVLERYLSPRIQADLNSSVLATKSSSSSLISRLSVYRRIFDSTLSVFLEFLSCGINVFDEIEDCLLKFCSSGANLIEYIDKLLKIVLQLHEHKILKFYKQSTEGNKEEDTLTGENEDNLKLIEIFDNILHSLLQHARQNPDSFNQVFRQSVRQSLRTLVREQYLVYFIQPEQVWYDVILKKIVSAVMAHLFHEIRSTTFLTVKERISDLPSFSAAMLPVICATSAETAFVCKKVILPIVKVESTDETEQRDQTLQTFAYLMYTLAENGKNTRSAKECIETLSQDVTGFERIFSKIKSTESSTKDDGSTRGDQEEKGEQDAPKEILVLEKSGSADLFMNDEEEFIM